MVDRETGGGLGRRKLIRFGLVGTGAAVFTAAVAGCGETVTIEKTVTKEVPVAVQIEGPATAGSIDLEVWYNQQRGGPGMHLMWSKAALDFQAVSPNVRVQVTPFPHKDIEQKTFTAIAGGTAPDIDYVFQDWAATFAANDVVWATEDITDSANAAEIIGDFYPGALGGIQVFGKTWGLPAINQPNFALYNRKLIDPLGIGDPYELFLKGENTIEWFGEYLAAVRTGEGIDAVYGAMEYEVLLKVQFIALWGFGVPVWNKDGTGSLLHTDEAAVVWNWLADQVKDGLVPARDAGSAIIGGDAGLLNSGKLGMIAWHGRQNNQKFAEDTRRSFSAAGFEEIEVAIAPLYSFPVGGQLFRHGGNSYAVTKQSKHPAEAFELLLHLVDAVGRGHMGLGLSIPSKKSLANADEFLNSLFPWELERREIFDLIQTNETPALLSPPGFSEIGTIVRSAYDEIVLSDVPPQEAMGAIEGQIADILAEAPAGMPAMQRTFPGDQ